MEELLSMLRPNFAWPAPMESIDETTPEIPPAEDPTALRMWGVIHEFLYSFSEQYCYWFDIPFCSDIIELPFGLDLKWSNKTSIEEATAMKMARKAGLPVPKVLCCGEHPGDLINGSFSILMTRLPGGYCDIPPLEFVPEERGPWVDELEECLRCMRLWQGPEKKICSVIGTSIHSWRVPGQTMGPFENEAELYEYLFSPISPDTFESIDKYEETLSRARKIEQGSYRTTFTHGDLQPQNILIDEDGHLSGITGWESAGWCPEYWDFTTTTLRHSRKGWWDGIVKWIGGDQYLEELDPERVLFDLTSGSYIGW